MLKPTEPQFIIEADACLIGGGATDFHSYIAYEFPRNCQSFNISVLEALNCLVACRLFITKEKHSSTVMIRCDNLATIQSFSRGAPKDKYLAAITRALWYCLAHADIDPIYTYVPGEQMTIPDALSRMSISQEFRDLAATIIKRLALHRVQIKGHQLDFHGFL